MKKTLSVFGVGVLTIFLAFGQEPGDKKGAAAKGDAAKGKETFEQCSVCHNVDNPEKKMGPSLQGLYKRGKLTNGKPVTDASVKAVINTGGNGMPAYAETFTEEEKTNLVAYIKTL